MNFTEIATDWFNSKKNFIKPSSLSTYHNIVFKYLVPYFKNIEEVKNTDVQRYVLYCTEKGQSKRTVHDNLKMLTYILKHGEEMGRCKAFVFNIDFPTVLNTRVRKSIAFNIAETRKLRAYLTASSYDDKSSLAVLIGLSMGLRIGEITALKFTDFDFKNKMLAICRTSQRVNILDENNTVIGTKIHVGTAKTKSSNRRIPVPDDVLEIVKYYANSENSEDNIFKGKLGGILMDNRLLRDKYYKILDRLGLNKITFHGLRHSFASNCIAANIDVKTTSSMLGHSDIKMTLDIYTHPSFEQQKSAINKLGKLFS